MVSTLAKNTTKPNPFWNHTTTYYKEREQLEDRRNVGESGCNSGDGTDQCPILDVYDDDEDDDDDDISNWAYDKRKRFLGGNLTMLSTAKFL